FAVGIVEKTKLITGESIASGDAIIGLKSSGIHSNGYSLVRQVIKDLDLNKKYEGLSTSLSEAVMEPTKIYAKAIKELTNNITVKGITHVTGGGFYENFPRMLPEGIRVEIDQSTWKIPKNLSLIQKQCDISEEEMYGVFNMSVCIAIGVDKQNVEQTLNLLNASSETSFEMGTTIDQKGVHF